MLKIFLAIILMAIMKNNVISKLIAKDNGLRLNNCASNFLNKTNIFSMEVTIVVSDETFEEFTADFYKIHKNKIINRKPSIVHTELNMTNEVYIITANDYQNILKVIQIITNDTYWNPNATTIVFINYIKNNEIIKIFDIFNHFYVFKLILINKIKEETKFYINTSGNSTFNKIVQYNCYNIASFNWNVNKNIKVDTLTESKTIFILNGIFPLTFLKTKTVGNEYQKIGYENYFFEIISEYSNAVFKRNYENKRVGNVFENHTTTGLLKNIKDGDFDGITGGMLLLEQRMKVFDYIYTRFADYYVIIIPKSRVIEKWKAIFLTFNTSVWCLMVVVFIVFLIISITFNIFNNSLDKTSTIFILFGYYFGIIYKYKTNFISNEFIIVTWCTGTWLYMSYLQSMLSSTFTSPVYHHQIQTLDEILELGFDLYITEVYKDFVSHSLEINLTNAFRRISYCDSMIECLRNVSYGGKRATITSFLYFKFHEILFHDKLGESTLFYLRQPFNQMWLTTYIRKGHPKLNKLRLLEMQIIEGGFLSKSFKDLKPIGLDTIKSRFSTIKRSDLAGIYYILISSWIITTIIFFIEMKLKR